MKRAFRMTPGCDNPRHLTEVTYDRIEKRSSPAFVREYRYADAKRIRDMERANAREVKNTLRNLLENREEIWE